MNINKKSLEGLKAISEGLALFIAGLEDSMKSTNEPVAIPEEKPSKKSAKKSAPVEEEEPDSEAEYTEEELNSMSYNDLKKLAKDLGISATGNRKELVKKLLEGDTEAKEEEEEPVKSAKKSKTPEPEQDEDNEEEDDEAEDDEEESESIAEQVEELVADMTDDELRDLLDSVKISSKGKRQSLISKIVTGVEEGIISLEEEEESDSEEEEDEEETAEKSADITEGMTKKRKKAFKELCDETNEQFENEEITREDLIEFINEFNGTKDKMKKVSDEDLITKYLEISALMIDDDGNIVEEGAYYINKEPYCCGHPLTYDKKKKVYRCETCGEEYEAE